jgi:hypothetical protein
MQRICYLFSACEVQIQPFKMRSPLAGIWPWSQRAGVTSPLCVNINLSQLNLS